MDNPVINESDYAFYQENHLNNVDNINTVVSEIETMLLDLEKKHLHLLDTKKLLISKLNLLSSIYSSNNAVKGREYVLRLKKVFEDYSHEIESERTRFGILDYLLIRIKELKKESIDDFPSIPHSYEINDKEQDIIPEEKNQTEKKRSIKKMTFNWVCFKWDGINIILPYSMMESLNLENLTNGSLKIINRRKEKKLVYNEQTYSFIEKYINFDLNYVKIILLINSSFCCPAQEIIRKIHSEKDILRDRIKPLSWESSNFIGTVRIAGINYYMLKKFY